MNNENSLNSVPPASSSGRRFTKIPKNLIKLCFIAAIVVLLGSTGWYFWAKDSNKADEFIATYPTNAPQVFDHMLDGTLNVTSMSERRIVRDSTGKDKLKETTTYDLSNMQKVRIFTASDIMLTPGSPDVRATTESISVPEGVFMRYKSITGVKDKDGLGGWFPVSSQDKTDLNGVQLFPGGNPNDYAKSYMGFYAPGTYEVETRQKLKEFIKQNELYQSFSENVHQVKHDGKQYYTYDIGLDNIKFRLFNDLLAKELSTTILSDATRGALVINGKAKFWVNTQTSRLEQIDMTLKNGDSQTIYYYDYNKLSDIAQPTPRREAYYVLVGLKPVLGIKGEPVPVTSCQKANPNGIVITPTSVTLETNTAMTLDKVRQSIHDPNITAIDYFYFYPSGAKPTTTATMFTVSTKPNTEATVIEALKKVSSTRTAEQTSRSCENHRN